MVNAGGIPLKSHLLWTILWIYVVNAVRCMPRYQMLWSKASWMKSLLYHTVSILNRYPPLRVQIDFKFQQISLDDPRYFGCICEVFRCLEDSGYLRLWCDETTTTKSIQVFRQYDLAIPTWIENWMIWGWYHSALQEARKKWLWFSWNATMVPQYFDFVVPFHSSSYS